MLDALGTVSFREGKDADAVMFYETSLKVDERNYSTAHTMLNLALSLANCGRRRESMILLSRLSSSENHAVRACCMRLLLRLKTGQTSRLVWSVDPFGRLWQGTDRPANFRHGWTQMKARVMLIDLCNSHCARCFSFWVAAYLVRVVWMERMRTGCYVCFPNYVNQIC